MDTNMGFTIYAFVYFLILSITVSGLDWHKPLDDATVSGGTGGRRTTFARCIIIPDADPNIRGIIDFRETTDWWAGSELTIKVNVSGFNPNDGTTRHGIHVHMYGDLTDRCTSAGPHYNPLNTNHGAPFQNKQRRHVGDLGNIEEDQNGNVFAIAQDRLASLTGRFAILGRSIVLHENEDDLGMGGDAESLITGNAGARVGCCIIGIAKSNSIV